MPLLIGALALLPWACSDDSAPAVDGTIPDARPDARPLAPEAGPLDLQPDQVFATRMGEGCKQSKDCDQTAPVCLTPDSTGLGICSAECVADDPSTPLKDEDSCPKGFVCGVFHYSNKDYNYCLKRCSPSLGSSGCPASSKRTCHPWSTRFVQMDQPVCFYRGCDADKDCPVLAAPTCTNDSECAPIGADAFCDSSQKRCARPGKCSPGGLCAPHSLGKSTAKVGDPCQSDFDCPNNGDCLFEENGESFPPSWRNGYCVVRFCSFAKTLPEFACPSGSTCNNLYYGGVCQKTCKLTQASDCRGYAMDHGGDYECYAWNNFTIRASQTIQVTAEPVCASSAEQTCDSLGQGSCSDLGDSKNTTSMTCRDRYTGAKKASDSDPMGVCLDDTASGPFLQIPDLGAPDARPPDAGLPQLDGVKPADAGAKDAAASQS